MVSKSPNSKKITGINDFEWNYDEEPHVARTAAIIKEHADIKKLRGNDSQQAYFATAVIFIQLTLAYFCGKSTCPWWICIPVAWIVGGTCVHSTTLAIHELSHNLFFKKPAHNVFFAYFCNSVMVFPYSQTFKKYHLEHHKKQGYDTLDTDIPTAWEGRFFRTPIRKFFWVFFQSLFYAFRPMLVNPKPMKMLEAVNILTQACFMFAIFKIGGLGSIVYLLLSMLFGLGLHPCAGHFIAEHYTNIWSGGNHKSGWTTIKANGEISQIDETFTYRGPLNWVSYNVGYHHAHHDFPNVPGSRLPDVEKMAPEFYNHVPECTSWPGTIVKYIFSNGNPFDRVKRPKQYNSKTKENINKKNKSE